MARAASSPGEPNGKRRKRETAHTGGPSQVEAEGELARHRGWRAAEQRAHRRSSAPTQMLQGRGRLRHRVPLQRTFLPVRGRRQGPAVQVQRRAPRPGYTALPLEPEAAAAAQGGCRLGRTDSSNPAVQLPRDSEKTTRPTGNVPLG